MTFICPSLSFPVHGNKENSSFFNKYLVKLLEERDSFGLSTKIILLTGSKIHLVIFLLAWSSSENVENSGLRFKSLLIEGDKSL
jgi:hypothetical protein